MSVCYSRLPFPIPRGLTQRVLVGAVGDGLIGLDIEYRVSGSSDDGMEGCCLGTSGLYWPSGPRLGGIIPTSNGTITFAAQVEAGDHGLSTLGEAVLTVTSDTCHQEACGPCSSALDCSDPEPVAT